MSKESSLIAQIGRTVGLWGDLKFYIYTDFPEQFQKGKTYKSSRGDLTIAQINPDRGTIRFVGYEGIDAAKKLTNVKIYADIEQTKQECNLKEGEHFWFDIIGCEVVQGDEALGKVSEIQRMADVDYLIIQTYKSLVDAGFAKQFLLPYIDRYIIRADIAHKTIFTQDAKDILEAS